jgi:glycerol-3-phosphate acyltransferase PlsY
MMSLILLFLFAYLCGSIPFGKIIAQRRGIDIQRRGSGNIGFANVKRILGWKDGILTLVGDISKGVLPTLIGLLYFNQTVAFFAGVMAILGHVFCIWLKFRGGKGIATGLGAVSILSPIAAIIGASIYILQCNLRAKSSTASIVGALSTAIVAVALNASIWWQYGLLLLIVAWTLRHNLWGTVPNYDA